LVLTSGSKEKLKLGELLSSEGHLNPATKPIT
jgi:hypothetical protein